MKDTLKKRKEKKGQCKLGENTCNTHHPQGISSEYMYIKKEGTTQ